MQCPLGPKVPSDVTDYWVLQQNSPSVESGSGGNAGSFSANTCNFLRISEMSLAERLRMRLHFTPKSLFVNCKLFIWPRIAKQFQSKEIVEKPTFKEILQYTL